MRRIRNAVIAGLLFIAVSLINKAIAADAAGLEIYYRHTSDSTYEFTVTFYRNCFSIGAGTTFIVNYQSASRNQSGGFNCAVLPITGTGVPALVPANLYNCTGAQSQLCNEEYVFRGSWTSPGRANDWVFSTTRCCRGGYTNTSATIGYVECGLNNLDFPDNVAKNWSPFWHNRRPNHPGFQTDTVINYLFRTLCMDNYYTLDLSAREYQGDSVSYNFYWPQQTGGVPVNYTFPYSFNNPLPLQANAPALQINPITGIIPITPGAPTGTGRYVLGVEAKEWRNDTIVSGGGSYVIAKQIGYVRRDMTIWIDDTTTCRRDSVHPKDITLTSGGGDTVLNVYFHTGVSGDPNSQVRCGTLSPDGSEFRLLDYTNYVAPYDSTIRSIGVNRAVWNCNAGLTDKVILHLSEPLKCQEYTIMLKTGTDLDVIESECGFLEPEFREGTITVVKNVSVNIDTNKAYLTFCLPSDDPFPKLTSSSQDSSSFPLSFFWTLNGDTLDGQEVPYVYGVDAGEYQVLVRDPYDCIGSDKITIFHDRIPEFKFDLPPYCDKFGQPEGMPNAIWAPGGQSFVKWEWFMAPLGKVAQGDTLKKPQLIENEWYRLVGTKEKVDARADKACSNEYTFYYGRDSFPPTDPLWVKFNEDYLQICTTDGDTARLSVWEEGIRTRYAPWHIQWFYNNLPIAGQTLTKTTTNEGHYRVFVEDTLGCWGGDTITVKKDERIAGPELPCSSFDGLATITFNWPLNYPVVGNEVSLDGGLTWVPSSNGNAHVLPGRGELLGRGLVSGACRWTESVNSEECPDAVAPPNIITPNNDGLNDVFEIKGLEFFHSNSLEIVDRWGNIVFRSDNYSNDWNGGEQPGGTYFYVLKVGDSENSEHKGTLTIIR